ncbi:MAG: hypothetical protein MUC97_18510 [Bernardetiaceae bacterium]|jgi:hypothetical protein|nr:hypothetical protein [Bernardetiaceae bacterium]
MKKLLLFLGLGLLGLSQAEAQTNRGYFGQVAVGGLLNTGETTAPGGNGSVFTFSTLHGYRLGPVGLGLAAGLDNYPNRLLMPLGLGLVATWPRQGRVGVQAGFTAARALRLSPKTVSLDQFNNGWDGPVRGWAWGFWPETQEQYGGWMFQPSVGLRVTAGAKTALLAQVGYRWQTVRNVIDFGSQQNEQRILYRRLWVGLGFEF